MFGVAQNIGGRKRQEDSFGFYFCNASERQPFGTAQVFVIADGMGGRAGGDIASQLAVDGFIDAMRRSANWDKSALMAALTDANNGIARTVSARREFDGMGSTLLGVLHYRGM